MEQPLPTGTHVETTVEAQVEATLEVDGLIIHIQGAEDLPAGTAITLSIVIGPGGVPAVVAPPAAVPPPAPRPRHFGSQG